MIPTAFAQSDAAPGFSHIIRLGLVLGKTRTEAGKTERAYTTPQSRPTALAQPDAAHGVQHILRLDLLVWKTRVGASESERGYTPLHRGEFTD